MPMREQMPASPTQFTRQTSTAVGAAALLNRSPTWGRGAQPRGAQAGDSQQQIGRGPNRPRAARAPCPLR
jgi:hypothetical protein